MHSVTAVSSKKIAKTICSGTASSLRSKTKRNYTTSIFTGACVLLLFSLASAIASPAQTFKQLFHFSTFGDTSNGGLPVGPLTLGPDGNFYGTTHEDGGSSTSAGTVFMITPMGKLTKLYTFCSLANCADGSGPTAGLTLGSDGNFYGTTWHGGTDNPTLCGTGITGGCGTVFKITPAGELTTLYSFCSEANCADGKFPFAGLAQGKDGNFYGVTQFGGSNCPGGGCGTIFKITPAGALTTLYSFCAVTNCPDGSTPTGGLVQGSDGNFYGTTQGTGSLSNAGTVFKVTPTGVLTTLHNFCSLANCADGEKPFASLLQATDGNFYGTTTEGGGNSSGTIFKITPAGAFSTVYSFCAVSDCTDGASPLGALIQASDGNLYGTTTAKAAHNTGTIFKLTLGGTVTTVYSFTALYFPNGLVQASNKGFYGTTNSRTGATAYTGYIYEFGPAPSTTTLTTSGSPSTIGQPVTFTATVTGKTASPQDSEMVSFYDGATLLASVPLSSGSASYTTSALSAKTHTIKAVYAGDLALATSSKALAQVVQLNPTTTTVTSSPNPSTVGAAVVLTATVASSAPSAATGTVTFRNGTTVVGSAKLISGKASITTKKLPAGTLTITATYNGDTESGKSSGTTTQTVQ